MLIDQIKQTGKKK